MVWRAVMSSVSTTPWTRASVRMCQTFTVPVSVSAASADASSRLADWVSRTRLRRGKRSASTPAKGEPSSDGPKRTAASTPRMSAESVSR